MLLRVVYVVLGLQHRKRCRNVCFVQDRWFVSAISDLQDPDAVDGPGLGSLGSVEALLSVLFKFARVGLQKSFFASPESVDPSLPSGRISGWTLRMAVLLLSVAGPEKRKGPGRHWVLWRGLTPDSIVPNGHQISVVVNPRKNLI